MTKWHVSWCRGAALIFTLAGAAVAAPDSKVADGIVTNSIGMRLAPASAGEFTMGSPASEPGRHPDEMEHRVILTRGFYIGVSEVTQREWTAVMGGFNPSQVKGDDLPVTGVKWEEAARFCEILSEKEGRRYRLPTEAEWEYACRAGGEGPFSGGEAAEVAWHSGNSGDAPHPVAQLKPNAWGLHDMHGNAMEWCSDWYAEKLGRDRVTDPSGPAEGEARVARGGSFRHRIRAARSAARHSLAPAYQLQHVGLRVVMEIDSEGQKP